MSTAEMVSRVVRPAPRTAPARTTVAVLAAALVVLGALFVPTAAWAHGEDETEEGYLLVQQALGHLAHDTSHTGIDEAMEKVDDALATEDQEGVDVAEVEQAMAALEAGQVDRARDLLQHSIRQALRDRPPATGNQTGTGLVVPELPGRSGIGGEDWGLLASSIVVLVLGAGLAFRYRPRDTVRELRRVLTHQGTGEDGGPS
jgi:hypothetical protein